MPGVIKRVTDQKREHAVYPTNNVNLSSEQKLFGRRIWIFSIASLILATVGFYCFGAYTYGNGDLIFYGRIDAEGKNNCITELLLFMTPVFPFVFAWMSIHTTHTLCFVTQIVTCGLSKRSSGNCIYFVAIPCYIPMLFTVLTTCYDVPNTVKLATFGLCTLFATIFIGTRHFSRKYCQCKKCLGIKDVLLQDETMNMLVDERTQFYQSDLKHWFNIEMSRDAQLAIRIEGGDIIHTFTKNSPKIQLQKGRYKIRD